MRALALLLLITVALPQVVLASGITIRPFLIDKNMVSRESAAETVVITNEHPDRKISVYATVNEITVGSDGEIRDFITPVMTDRTNTITSWIEIRRGRIAIDPASTVEVPLTIKVHPFAEPGEYHVFVGFVAAAKRSIAEETAMRGDADGVIVKVTVDDQRVDSMRIVNMSVDRIVSREDEKQVEITVENTGDIASSPQGEMIFYDSRGKEISTTVVNENGEKVEPNSTKTFIATIPLASNVGQFKANVNLLYGENQRANLYDTTTFFLLPIKYLVILAFLLLFLIAFLLILMKRRRMTYVSDDQGDSVSMYVRDGHEPNPQDHDIDLSKQ